MNIKTLTDEIDKITNQFVLQFANLDEDQLNWKPNDKTWSIAQNIHHLILINESYYPAIQAVKQNRYRLPFMAKIGFLVNFSGKMILNSVKPDRKRKIRTFAIWEPSQSEIDKNIVNDFSIHQAGLKHILSDCGDLFERSAVISSPANKNIVYKLETAFEIIVTHEKRHYEQALGMLQLIKNQT